MNYASNFEAGGLDSLSHAHVDLDALAQGGKLPGSFTVPDAHLLFSGDFHKSGNDLIISDELHHVVVQDYFRGEQHPTLLSPEGASLDPRVVDTLSGYTQYAQAGGLPAGTVVGHVAKLTGSGSVVRSGVTTELQNGDAVYQTDVVQTGSNSAVGLVLNDGSTFNLSANARMMLNDVTYSASSTSNTSLVTLVQGAASFVAGQVAKTGDMKVATPIATMGIRGTAVILDISSTDGHVTISVVNQRDSRVHAVQVYNTRGELIGTVTSSGSVLTLTPTANFNAIAQQSAKTPAQVQQEFNTFQSLLTIYDARKLVDPNLPQHTHNDANPQSKYALGSSPPFSLVPESHGLFGNGPENTTEKHAATASISNSSNQTDAFTQNVADAFFIAEKDVPSPPFVVNPPPILPITASVGVNLNPVMSALGNVVYDSLGVIYYYDRASGITTTVAVSGNGVAYSQETISSNGLVIAFRGVDATGIPVVYIWGNDPSDAAHYHVMTRLATGSSPALSGDGSTILVELPGGNIGIFDLQGHSRGVITPASIGETGALSKPAISADGHLIAFWNTDASSTGHLYTYDVSTGVVTEIATTSNGGAVLAASISADGRYVVYQSEGQTGHGEISMYDLATGHIVFSTANVHEILPGDSKNPVISPDGHFIIFTSTAQLTPGDTNGFADTYVVDVTNPAAPIYTLLSEGGDAPSDGGVAISAAGLYQAFGSNASFASSRGSNVFVADPTSGRSAIIQETAHSPVNLTASGLIGLTGNTSGVTLTVTDRDGHATDFLTASLSSDGQTIQWNFIEARSDFLSLNFGQDLTKQFLITLNYTGGSTTIPVSVTVHDAVQPVVTPADVAPVANPVTLTDAHGAGSYLITAAALLAGVGDIDGPSLSITDVSINSGGGTIVHNEDGTWTYTPAQGFFGGVVFHYSASDGTFSSSSTAALTIINDNATISGDIAGTVVEDLSPVTGGAVIVHDINPGEAVFQPVSSEALTATFGNFSFNATTGAWTYALVPDRANALADGQVAHDRLTVTSADGTASKVIDVIITGTNDAPVAAQGSTTSTTISVETPSHNTVSSELAAQLDGPGLINYLPNGVGSEYGTVSMAPNDDGSSGAINITSVFGEQGLNFFGHYYTSIYINNNGNITFNAPVSAYTPSQINAGFNNPIIAPFWADVDTRGAGSVYYDFDVANGVMTITWDHVGYYSRGTDKLDTFQLVLINEGDGNFDIEYRYGDIQWTTGSASGGSNGLGGTPARAGYSAGDGVHYFELPQSGHQSDLLNLPHTDGNTGIAGVDQFEVRNGEVGPVTLTSTGTINFSDSDLTDSHNLQSVAYTGAGTALGTLSLTMVSDTTGTGTGGQFAWTYTASSSAVHAALEGTETDSRIETFAVVIGDGHGGTLTQTVSVTLTEDDGGQTASANNLRAFATADSVAPTPQQAADSGAVVVAGTAHDDVLTSNFPATVFFGNSGHDTFVFAAASGHSVIADFTPSDDKIDLGHNVPADAAGFAHWLASAATSVGSDTLINLDPNASDPRQPAANTVLLKNVNIDSLHGSDFIVHGGNIHV